MATNLGDVWENPITLKTRKAMRVLGALISDWTRDENSRPPNARAEADGRILVIGVDAEAA